MPSPREASAPLKPLSGVRVLDFTAFPPGGYCTVMLADLGAEVVRVEPPSQKGKPSLVIGQVALSRGKRSMTLDLRNPASAGVLERLAPSVDVVVENARPGAMEARGFGYSHARASNPRIVWCAITGFGQTGPYADQPGHDLAYLAHSGLLAALSDDLPWHPGAQLATPLGAMSAVVGIQAALLQRMASGDGAFVDISLSESTGWTLTGGINPLSDTPLVIPATPDRRLYACADGRFVAVTSAEPRTWSALCEGLGAPELTGSFRDAADAEATTNRLAAIFMTRTAAEWIQRLTQTGAAIMPVNRGSELIADPQVIARGSVVDAAGVPVPASPIRLRNADGAQTRTVVDAPHAVGQDTDSVLKAAGFAEHEIERLLKDGVI